MKKHNLLKSLILVTLVLTGTTKAFGNADLVLALSVSVPESVSITKQSSTEHGTINPQNGTHGGLNASFKLITNNQDYDFIVAAKILTADGEISAYTSNGDLLFGNTTALPTMTAADNAKAGNKDNPNVIAYPVSVTATDGTMDINYDSSFITNEGKGAYRVSIMTGTTGTIQQVVGTTPVDKTYSLASDQAGSYTSTVYITAVSK